jgi:hypothetical protein
MNEIRQERRLPTVEFPVGKNADNIIGVQINRIGVGRRDVHLEPSEYLPWTGPKKVLPACYA